MKNEKLTLNLLERYCILKPEFIEEMITILIDKRMFYYAALKIRELLEKDEHPVQYSQEFYQKKLCELVSKYDLSFEDFSIDSFFE